METIDLGYGIQLPLAELDFSFTRSGGPGGQHVNRAETKVELRWDVTASETLAEPQRSALIAHLAPYLTDDGILVLKSSETRSQHRNREAVIERLQVLVRQALQPRRKRRATRPTKASRVERLKSKKRQSEKKALRGKVDPGRD